MVDVKNTTKNLDLHNGLGDWTLTWDNWLKGSALASSATARPRRGPDDPGRRRWTRRPVGVWVGSTMEYVRLGKTGLKVSRICLGMMSYGDPKSREWALDEDAAEPFVRRAAEARHQLLRHR